MTCEGWYSTLCKLLDGAWLSLVERTVRDREVGGSNPLAPTILSSEVVFVKECRGVPFALRSNLIQRAGVALQANLTIGAEKIDSTLDTHSAVR